MVPPSKDAKVCTFCGEVYTTHAALVRHLRFGECTRAPYTHDKRIVCAMKKHINHNVESARRTVAQPCTECGSIVKDRYKMVKHYLTQHGKVVKAGDLS